MYALVAIAFVVFFFLGWVQSHWIAPAVLFVVVAPLILETMWSAPPQALVGSLVGTLAIFYLTFALGRFVGTGRSQA